MFESQQQAERGHAQVAGIESSEPHAGFSLWRYTLAVVASCVVGALGLRAWHAAKIALMDWWSEISLPFMPILIGCAVGLVIRMISPTGDFGIAGIAVIVTALGSVQGMGLQHILATDFYLKREVALLYSETKTYAESVAALKTDEEIKNALAQHPVSVIARFAVEARSESPDEFWYFRNLAHLNWIAARQIIINGQGGPERTIWEATQVLEDKRFMDQAVASRAKEPVSENAVAVFVSWEQPFLRELARGTITREQMAESLIEVVHHKVGWAEWASRGFGPFIGMGTLLGCFLSFKLVRRADEMEIL